MNHNPSDDSANVPPSGQAVVGGTATVTEHSASYQLNSSLQQALSCLDIKLEDELLRFRSQQERQLGSFDSEGEMLTADTVTPAISHTLDDIDDPRDRDRASDAVAGMSSSGFIIIDGLSIPPTSIHNAPAQPLLGSSTSFNYAPISLYRENAIEQPENLNLNFSRGGEIAPFHDEYGSSSQELLRQIQSGYSHSAAPASDNRSESKSPPQSPKNYHPLKIGAVAAACLLAGGAVYAYLNPSLLVPLSATKVVPNVATTSALGQLIQSPNLAANEFTELNLSMLNTIKLPTTATTNVNMPTTVTTSPAQAGISTAPVAIPFNRIGAKVVAPSAIIASQPRLADSLIQSLLPPTFQSFARRGQTTLPGVRR
ncbi:hypothetical protein [Chamaesiphon sp.]|uniref:hypothetical protein n=1 Tax=Chamaesiphon sp. TaxID=2814140 RepID=UPI003593CB48